MRNLERVMKQKDSTLSDLEEEISKNKVYMEQ